MSYDYSTYASDDNNYSGSDSDDSGSGSGPDQEDKNLTMVPHAAIEGDLVKVFGNENPWGQSLGLSWENVELVDGCLYYDAEKDKFKVFPWKDVIGISPSESDDVSADDANQYLMKTYGTTEKRYELVEAVVPEEDEPVGIGNAVMWYSGSDEYGPKAASRTLASILTQKGTSMVNDQGAIPDDEYINHWLADVSAENVLRDDLQGRRFAFFEVKKDSNQSDRQYHYPVVVDTETGAQITVQNSANDEEDGGETESETGSGVPEPIADFVSTCASLGFDDADRAAQLLGDLIEDDGNDLTADMVEEFGGEDAVVGEVAN